MTVSEVDYLLLLIMILIYLFTVESISQFPSVYYCSSSSLKIVCQRTILKKGLVQKVHFRVTGGDTNIRHTVGDKRY